MSYDQTSEELLKLNKEEEFEYFKSSKLGSTSIQFKKWNIDEHKKFLNAIIRYDFMKSNEMLEIQREVNLDNPIQRGVDELQIHINVYKNYCNKQKNLKPFLNNIANNAYQSYIDSLDTGITKIPQVFENTSISTSSLMSAMSPGGTNNSGSTPTTPTQHVIASVPLPPSLNIPLPTPSNPVQLQQQQQLQLQQQLQQQQQQQQQQMQQQMQHTPQPSSPTLKSPSKPSGKARAKSKPTASTIPSLPPPLEIEYSQEVMSAAAKKNQKILSEPWTSDDQKKLEDSLEKYPASRFSSVSRWQAISKDLGISPKAVALRYNQMLNNLIPKNNNNSNNNNININTNTNNNNIDEYDDPNNKKRKIPPTTKISKGQPKKKEKLDSTPDLPTYVNIANQIPNTNTSTPTIQPISNSIMTPFSVSNNNTSNNLEQSENQKNFNIFRSEELIIRNAMLLEDIKKNIMLNQTTTPESVNILKEFIENSNSALKSSIVWSNSSNEMPSLPFKVNDMIIGLLTQNLLNNDKNTSALLNNTNNLSSAASTKYASLKKPLPKEITEWNLVIPPENK